MKKFFLEPQTSNWTPEVEGREALLPQLYTVGVFFFLVWLWFGWCFSGLGIWICRICRICPSLTPRRSAGKAGKKPSQATCRRRSQAQMSWSVDPVDPAECAMWPAPSATTWWPARLMQIPAARIVSGEVMLVLQKPSMVEQYGGWCVAVSLGTLCWNGCLTCWISGHGKKHQKEWELERGTTKTNLVTIPGWFGILLNLNIRTRRDIHTQESPGHGENYKNYRTFATHWVPDEVSNVYFQEPSTNSHQHSIRSRSHCQAPSQRCSISGLTSIHYKGLCVGGRWRYIKGRFL